MKFRATFSSVGVQWLERFVPVFEKLGKELSVLLTPSTLHLVQDHTASGGLELHADVLREEVFDEYKISSNNEDKIAFHLEPAVLHRVLRGLIGSEATHVEVKLIKRLVAPERSSPSSTSPPGASWTSSRTSPSPARSTDASSPASRRS